MNVHLEIANHEDLEQVVSYVRAYHEFEGISDEEELRSAITPLLGESDFGRIWIIHSDSKPVGYVAICFGYSIEFAGRDAFVDEMFIIDEERAKGLGRGALRLLGTEAIALGVKALHLEVAHENEPARRLYAAAGFKPRERFFLMSCQLSDSDKE